MAPLEAHTLLLIAVRRNSSDTYPALFQLSVRELLLEELIDVARCASSTARYLASMPRCSLAAMNSTKLCSKGPLFPNDFVLTDKGYKEYERITFRFSDGSTIEQVDAEHAAAERAAKREQLSKDVFDAALKFNTALSGWNAAAKAATDAGMTVCFAPHLPSGRRPEKTWGRMWPHITVKVRS
jgi:hypothetical protein